MDNMLEHPWTQLQLLIKGKWLTQKAFASILWKKVSEVNELLKWKRNITIQRDYLLHQHLWTPIKYWILKQIDYDYSLLDIEEIPDTPLSTQEEQNKNSQHSDIILSDGEVYSASWEASEHNDRHSEQNEESMDANTSFWTTTRPAELSKDPKSPLDKGDTAKPRGFEQQQETPIQEQKNEDDEDFRKRVNIFRSF